MKVLLIEDNETLSKMMAKYFRIKKVDCTVLNDGAEGLEQILDQKHDVVLLDLAMPDVSGYDIIDELEKKGKLKEIKIIILTASSISDLDLVNMQKRGIRACLRKPIDLDQLYKTVISCVD